MTHTPRTKALLDAYALAAGAPPSFIQRVRTALATAEERGLARAIDAAARRPNDWTVFYPPTPTTADERSE